MSDAVTEIGFGTLPDGRPVKLFTLRNAAGLLARITNFGTIITELHVPDRQGRLGDVVLGFDRLETYLADTHYLGCTVGRVANRTAKGRFTLDGKTYKLAVNNGSNHLHGGLQGFDRALWHAVPQKGAAIQFTHTSPDGDEGYPGKLEVTVLMTLTDANELRIDYTATTDRATPINLTNHSYFNFLGGGDILGHELMLAADHYTPVDDTSIPVGEIRPVAGGPMDFNQRQPIGARFNQLTGERIGYDHNYVLRGGGKSLALAAQLYEPQTGRFGHPGVHRQLAGRHGAGQGRQVGATLCGHRAGDPAFPRQHQPGAVSLRGVASGPDVPEHHDLPFCHAINFTI